MGTKMNVMFKKTVATNMRKKLIITMSLVALIISLIITAFYNGLVVRKYIVRTGKLERDQQVRIVLIADLHSHVYGKNQSHIADLIKRQKPDIIALAGDIADDVEPIKGVELFLKALQDIAPIYYVTGNHEVWSGKVDEIKKLFRIYGAIVLENSFESVMVNGVELIIGGVDDPDIVHYENKKYNYDWHKAVYNKFSTLRDVSAYKILISHRPELIDLYKTLPVDLVLSGHSHGGQVRIPFLLNGLYAPDQGWFPKYAGGMYSHNELIHIVSRGVSYNPRLPRIFNPPEVVVIEISG